MRSVINTDDGKDTSDHSFKSINGDDILKLKFLFRILKGIYFSIDFINYFQFLIMTETTLLCELIQSTNHFQFFNVGGKLLL